MDTPVEKCEWYAIQVAAKKEKRVESSLVDKGYECFLPLYPKRTTWSDRIKVTSVPLFPGYVFSRFDVRRRLPILITPNVQAVVGTGKHPIAVPDPDIEAVRVAIQNGMLVEPCDCLKEGDLVRVTTGPLMGVEGVFMKHRSGSRLILSVALIQRSVAVEIDRVYVEPVSKRTATNRLSLVGTN